MTDTPTNDPNDSQSSQPSSPIPRRRFKRVMPPSPPAQEEDTQQTEQPDAESAQNMQEQRSIKEESVIPRRKIRTDASSTTPAPPPKSRSPLEPPVVAHPHTSISGTFGFNQATGYRSLSAPGKLFRRRRIITSSAGQQVAQSIPMTQRLFIRVLYDGQPSTEDPVLLEVPGSMPLRDYFDSLVAALRLPEHFKNTLQFCLVIEGTQRPIQLNDSLLAQGVRNGTPPLVLYAK